MTGPHPLVAAALAAAAVAIALPPTRPRRLRRAMGGPGPRRAPGAQRRAARPARGGGWRRPAAEPPPVPVPVPLVLDLVASVLEAGAPPAGALATVASCLESAGDPLGAVLAAGQSAPSPVPVGAGPAARRRGRVGPDRALQSLFEALHLAAVTGLGPAALVRAAAEQERRRRAAAQALAARRLAVFVVLPMALCLLPAFVLLAIVPVVLDLLSGL